MWHFYCCENSNKNDFQKLISFESMFTLQANETFSNEFQLQTDPNTHLTWLFITHFKQKKPRSDQVS